MNIVKRTYLRVYGELHARLNLYQLRDARAFTPFLGPVLYDAARVWPDVLRLRPETILDAGAHDGVVAEQLVALYRPRFIGLVEPLPQMVGGLQARFSGPGQKIFPCAVGRKAGSATLNVLASMPSSSLLEVAPGSDAVFHRSMDKIETVEVPVRTLDSIFDECGLPELDLLKIDVQGYELEAFAGGARTLQSTRMVVTEVSFFQHYQCQPMFQEVYACLQDSGLELAATFGYSYDSRGLPLQCDAVFINRAMLQSVERPAN